MATLQASDIPDIVVTTRVSEGRLRFQQIAQNLPFYEIFSRWFKRDKVMFSSGYKIQRTLMTKLNRAAAKHVGFLQPGDYLIHDRDGKYCPAFLRVLKAEGGVAR